MNIERIIEPTTQFQGVDGKNIVNGKVYVFIEPSTFKMATLYDLERNVLPNPLETNELGQVHDFKCDDVHQYWIKVVDFEGKELTTLHNLKAIGGGGSEPGEKYFAGENIAIDDENVISVVDTKNVEFDKKSFEITEDDETIRIKGLPVGGTEVDVTLPDGTETTPGLFKIKMEDSNAKLTFKDDEDKEHEVQFGKPIEVGRYLEKTETKDGVTIGVVAPDPAVDSDVLNDKSLYLTTDIATNTRLGIRSMLKVWNYIQSKIQNVLGLTKNEYSGNSLTASRLKTIMAVGDKPYIKMSWNMSGTDGTVVRFINTRGGGPVESRVLGEMYCGGVLGWNINSVFWFENTNLEARYSVSGTDATVFIKTPGMDCHIGIMTMGDPSQIRWLKASTEDEYKAASAPVPMVSRKIAIEQSIQTLPSDTNDKYFRIIANKNTDFEDELTIKGGDGQTSEVTISVSNIQGYSYMNFVKSWFANNKVFSDLIEFAYKSNNADYKLYLHSKSTAWNNANIYSKFGKLGYGDFDIVEVTKDEFEAATLFAVTANSTHYGKYKSATGAPYAQAYKKAIADGITDSTTFLSSVSDDGSYFSQRKVSQIYDYVKGKTDGIYVPKFENSTSSITDKSNIATSDVEGGEIKYYKSVTLLWTYIASKIKSVLGLDKDTYGGKSANSTKWNGYTTDEHHEIGTSTAYVAGGTYSRYYHFASLKAITGVSQDDGLIIKCYCTYGDTPKMAILRTQVRTDNSTTGLSKINVGRLFATEGISDDMFIAGISNRAGDTYIDLFYKPNTAWSTMGFKVEWNTNRGTRNAVNNWTLLNSDGTENTNVYDDLVSAGTAIRGKNYTSTKNITDYVGKVKEADTIDGYHITIGAPSTAANTLNFI